MAAQLLVAIGGMVGAALIIAFARAVGELARNVRETTPVVRGLVGDVAQIRTEAARDRERLAAVEAAVWWPHENPQPHRWSARPWP